MCVGRVCVERVCVDGLGGVSCALVDYADSNLLPTLISEQLTSEVYFALPSISPCREWWVLHQALCGTSTGPRRAVSS